MFHLPIPNPYEGRCYYKDDDVKFEPPVFEQRYMAVLRIIELTQWADQIKKVSGLFEPKSMKYMTNFPFKQIVEFGCAEMRLLFALKRLKIIEHIIEVSPI